MKNFFTWDEALRDLVIVTFLVFLVYVSASVTPINFETISSGDAFVSLFAYARSFPPEDFFGPTLFVTVGHFVAVVTVLVFAGIVWTTLRLREVSHKQHAKYAPIDIEEIEAKEKMVQWQVILNHLNAENSAEWKLAILEADNMLDEILETEGYRGESIGDRLKAMDPGTIGSYRDAWEAHKVRNRIAHEGAATIDLSKKEARDTIGKFEKVFKELGYI